MNYVCLTCMEMVGSAPDAVAKHRCGPKSDLVGVAPGMDPDTVEQARWLSHSQHVEAAVVANRCRSASAGRRRRAVVAATRSKAATAEDR